MDNAEKKIVDDAFHWGVTIKFLIGLGEAVVGIIFAFFGKFIVNNFIVVLARQEIAENPHDLIANFLIKSAGEFSAGSHIFAVAYLLIHAAVNIFLAVSLLKNKLWAYPTAIVAFGIFIFYQFYRYLHTNSPLLLLFTIFDLFIIVVVWLEYKNRVLKK